MSLEGAHLNCVDDAGVAVTYPAKGRNFTVGSFLNSNLVLPNAERLHCEIQIDPSGRVTINNHSRADPVLLNGAVVNAKRPLLDGSRITILNREYTWNFPKTHEFEHVTKTDTGTLENILPKTLAEQPPSSCPSLKTHRFPIANRMTVHNFRYSINSDDEGNTSIESRDESNAHSELSESITEEAEQSDCTDQPSKEEVMVIVDLVEATQNKENGSTPGNLKLLQQCARSEVVITSFSPRETGVKTEKSFAQVLKASALTITTPKSVYSTPKSVLSELNEDSRDVMDFCTPSTSKKALSNKPESSMHLIDLTTPQKLRPTLTATKHLQTSLITVDSASESSDSSVIDITNSATPKMPGLSKIAKTPIGVKATPTSRAGLSTPRATPQTLIKRALLTSTKKLLINQTKTPVTPQNIANPTAERCKTLTLPARRLAFCPQPRTINSAQRAPQTSPRRRQRQSLGTPRENKLSQMRKSLAAANRTSLATGMKNKLVARARRVLVSPSVSPKVQSPTGIKIHKSSTPDRDQTEELSRTFTIDDSDVDEELPNKKAELELPTDKREINEDDTQTLLMKMEILLAKKSHKSTDDQSSVSIEQTNSKTNEKPISESNTSQVTVTDNLDKSELLSDKSEILSNTFSIETEVSSSPEKHVKEEHAKYLGTTKVESVYSVDAAQQEVALLTDSPNIGCINTTSNIIELSPQNNQELEDNKIKENIEKEALKNANKTETLEATSEIEQSTKNLEADKLHVPITEDVIDDSICEEVLFTEEPLRFATNEPDNSTVKKVETEKLAETPVLRRSQRRMSADQANSGLRRRNSKCFSCDLAITAPLTPRRTAQSADSKVTKTTPRRRVSAAADIGPDRCMTTPKRLRRLTYDEATNCFSNTPYPLKPVVTAVEDMGVSAVIEDVNPDSATIIVDDVSDENYGIELPTSTSCLEEPDHVDYKGMRELLKTPKSCSTPRFKGLRELVRTPKVLASPNLENIEELLERSEESSSSTPRRSLTVAYFEESSAGMDQFLKTPTAKNIMMANEPATAVLEKHKNVQTPATEYSLSESLQLDEIFDEIPEPELTEINDTVGMSVPSVKMATANDPHNTSTVDKNDSISSERLMNKTSGSRKDLVTSTTYKKTGTDNIFISLERSESPHDISGLQLLDQTSESMFSEPLMVSGVDSSEVLLNETKASSTQQAHQVEKEHSLGLAEPLVFSEDDEDVQVIVEASAKIQQPTKNKSIEQIVIDVTCKSSIVSGQCNAANIETTIPKEHNAMEQTANLEINESKKETLQDKLTNIEKSTVDEENKDQNAVQATEIVEDDDQNKRDVISDDYLSRGKQTITDYIDLEDDEKVELNEISLTKKDTDSFKMKDTHVENNELETDTDAINESTNLVEIEENQTDDNCQASETIQEHEDDATISSINKTEAVISAYLDLDDEKVKELPELSAANLETNSSEPHKDNTNTEINNSENKAELDMRFEIEENRGVSEIQSSGTIKVDEQDVINDNLNNRTEKVVTDYIDLDDDESVEQIREISSTKIETKSCETYDTNKETNETENEPKFNKKTILKESSTVMEVQENRSLHDGPVQNPIISGAPTGLKGTKEVDCDYVNIQADEVQQSTTKKISEEAVAEIVFKEPKDKLQQGNDIADKNESLVINIDDSPEINESSCIVEDEQDELNSTATENKEESHIEKSSNINEAEKVINIVEEKCFKTGDRSIDVFNESFNESDELNLNTSEVRFRDFGVELAGDGDFVFTKSTREVEESATIDAKVKELEVSPTNKTVDENSDQKEQNETTTHNVTTPLRVASESANVLKSSVEADITTCKSTSETTLNEEDCDIFASPEKNASEIDVANLQNEADERKTEESSSCDILDVPSVVGNLIGKNESFSKEQQDDCVILEDQEPDSTTAEAESPPSKAIVGAVGVDSTATPSEPEETGAEISFHKAVKDNEKLVESLIIEKQDVATISVDLTSDDENETEEVKPAVSTEQHFAQTEVEIKRIEITEEDVSTKEADKILLPPPTTQSVDKVKALSSENISLIISMPIAENEISIDLTSDDEEVPSPRQSTSQLFVNKPEAFDRNISKSTKTKDIEKSSESKSEAVDLSRPTEVLTEEHELLVLANEAIVSSLGADVSAETKENSIIKENSDDVIFETAPQEEIANVTVLETPLRRGRKRSVDVTMTPLTQPTPRRRGRKQSQLIDETPKEVLEENVQSLENLPEESAVNNSKTDSLPETSSKQSQLIDDTAKKVLEENVQSLENLPEESAVNNSKTNSLPETSSKQSQLIDETGKKVLEENVQTLENLPEESEVNNSKTDSLPETSSKQSQLIDDTAKKVLEENVQSLKNLPEEFAVNNSKTDSLPETSSKQSQLIDETAKKVLEENVQSLKNLPEESEVNNSKTDSLPETSAKVVPQTIQEPPQSKPARRGRKPSNMTEEITGPKQVHIIQSTTTESLDEMSLQFKGNKEERLKSVVEKAENIIEEPARKTVLRRRKSSHLIDDIIEIQHTTLGKAKSEKVPETTEQNVEHTTDEIKKPKRRGRKPSAEQHKADVDGIDEVEKPKRRMRKHKPELELIDKNPEAEPMSTIPEDHDEVHKESKRNKKDPAHIDIAEKVEKRTIKTRKASVEEVPIVEPKTRRRGRQISADVIEPYDVASQILKEVPKRSGRKPSSESVHTVPTTVEALPQIEEHPEGGKKKTTKRGKKPTVDQEPKEIAGTKTTETMPSIEEALPDKRSTRRGRKASAHIEEEAPAPPAKKATTSHPRKALKTPTADQTHSDVEPKEQINLSSTINQPTDEQQLTVETLDENEEQLTPRRREGRNIPRKNYDETSDEDKGSSSRTRRTRKQIQPKALDKHLDENVAAVSSVELTTTPTGKHKRSSLDPVKTPESDNGIPIEPTTLQKREARNIPRHNYAEHPDNDKPHASRAKRVRNPTPKALDYAASQPATPRQHKGKTPLGAIEKESSLAIPGVTQESPVSTQTAASKKLRGGAQKEHASPEATKPTIETAKEETTTKATSSKKRGARSRKESENETVEVAERPTNKRPARGKAKTQEEPALIEDESADQPVNKRARVTTRAKTPVAIDSHSGDEESLAKKRTHSTKTRGRAGKAVSIKETLPPVEEPPITVTGRAGRGRKVHFEASEEVTGSSITMLTTGDKTPKRATRSRRK